MNIQGNAIITSDALTAMQRLPSEAVILTYLDPPWGTALYSDEQKQRKHATFISLIAQHIHRVLTHDGTLFAHWTQASPINIRLILSRIFSKEPCYEITWQKKNIGTSKGLPIDNDLILAYSKSDTPIQNILS